MSLCLAHLELSGSSTQLGKVIHKYVHHKTKGVEGGQEGHLLPVVQGVHFQCVQDPTVKTSNLTATSVDIALEW